MRKLLLSTAFAAVSLVSVPAFAETAATEAFVANVRLNAVFLAKASGLAADHSDNAALRAFAGKEAAAEIEVVSAIDDRAMPEVAQSVPVQSGPLAVASNDVLTGRSAAIDAPVSPAAFGAPAGTGALMPAAMIAFDHLSSAKGEAFDALYKATQVNALRQLAALYNAYSLTGDDVGLRQMAIEQLAAVNGRIAEIGRI